MDVGITGSSGLIGSALREALTSQGHRPIGLVRRQPKPGADEILFQPDDGTIDEDELEGIDAIVNLAGAPVGGRRWSESYKKLLVSSRVDTTSLIAYTIASLNKPPRVLLSGSAIGYYGTGSPDTKTEQSPKGEGFLAELCGQWEAATEPAVDAGIRTALLRTGLVLSADGGLLARLKPSFAMGLGAKLGDGTQTMSWIAMIDMVAALMFLLDPPSDDQAISGPVNMVAPNPVSNAVFTAALGEALGRPTFLKVPGFGPRLALGKEMTDEFLLADQTVKPEVLARAGFSFDQPQLDTCLKAELS